MDNSTRHTLTLACLFTALLGACRTDHSQEPTTVLTYTSPMWYEETGRYFQLAPDGRLAIYGSGPRSRLYDVATGEEDSAAWHASMDQVREGAFEPTGLRHRMVHEHRRSAEATLNPAVGAPALGAE
jgi:hypothetical protein